MIRSPAFFRKKVPREQVMPSLLAHFSEEGARRAGDAYQKNDENVLVVFIMQKLYAKGLCHIAKGAALPFRINTRKA